MRERRELPGREGLRDRHERQQPVLEPLLLGRGRGAGEKLEPAVDLEGVGRDRHRVLPARAQPLRQLDRDGRLADAGRTEDRYHGFRGGHDR